MTTAADQLKAEIHQQAESFLSEYDDFAYKPELFEREWAQYEGLDVEEFENVGKEDQVAYMLLPGVDLPIDPAQAAMLGIKVSAWALVRFAGKQLPKQKRLNGQIVKKIQEFRPGSPKQFVTKLAEGVAQHLLNRL